MHTDRVAISSRVGGPGPALVVESFAFIAVATSFIGTVLGLQEFFLEQWSARAAQGLIESVSFSIECMIIISKNDSIENGIEYNGQVLQHRRRSYQCSSPYSLNGGTGWVLVPLRRYSCSHLLSSLRHSSPMLSTQHQTSRYAVLYLLYYLKNNANF